MLNDSIEGLARKFLKGQISFDNWRIYTAIKIIDLKDSVETGKEIARRLSIQEDEGGT